MFGVPVILPPSEGFTVYRETANIRVCILISHYCQYALYIVGPRLAAVPGDVVGPGLGAVPGEDVMAGVEPV